ncbi:MAG: J domain-containing protein [Minwuia sp.]|nr:J domain-containing protein [Minwuia sp.]
MARTQQRSRTRYAGRIIADDPSARPCEMPGCLEAGEFRAPKSRDGAAGYHMFCLDHVREYNKSYNYFADMEPDEAETFQHSAAYGHRQTWPMGHRTATMRTDVPFQDPFGFSDEVARKKAVREAEKARQGRQYTAEQRAAFRTLDVDPTDDLHALKRHYKQLVKRFHPDANGGDRRAEDRLKNINQAFSVLNAGLS